MQWGGRGGGTVLQNTKTSTGIIIQEFIRRKGHVTSQHKISHHSEQRWNHQTPYSSDRAGYHRQETETWKISLSSRVAGIGITRAVGHHDILSTGPGIAATPLSCPLIVQPAAPADGPHRSLYWKQRYSEVRWGLVTIG